MKKRALLIIDMQNDFFGEEAPMKCEGVNDTIPVINEALKIAREKNIPIFHIYQEHRKDKSDFGRELERSKPHCIAGTRGAQFIEGINIEPTDYFILKKRFSSFFQTDLDLMLRGLGIEEIVLGGIATDGCVRATAVDAHQLGYYFKLLKNGTAGALIESHEDSIKYLCRLQKDVLISTEQI
ncbi:MAG: cysteine hydrolase [Firmicutes bacterium]|nr:cysteine hydrolase [Bacillota bacterium]